MKSSQFDANERLESIKAGTVAAVSVTLAYVLVTLVNNLLLAERFDTLARLQTDSINLPFGVASALISGFLFGVTYRYIIREDTNSHLNDGAVLAFGLVRGLARMEAGLNLWLCGIFGIESIIMFAIARFTLDVAIRQSWIKPFKSG